MPKGIFERTSKIRDLYEKHKSKNAVPYSLFSLRLRRGFNIKEAISRKKKKYKEIKFPIKIKGKEFKNLDQISKEFQISAPTIKWRIYKGIRGDKLIKNPRPRVYATNEERIRARRETNKKYRIKYRDKRLQQTKDWFRRNSDYIKKYNEKNHERIYQRVKAYRQKNKNKRNKYNSEWRKKNKGHPNQIWETVRSRFSAWLKNKNYKNRDEMKLIIGCNKKQLKKYLEKKFKKGMSWKNHGEWHIDHIRPLAKFNPKSDVDIMKAFHYSNMQPLWAIENLRKSKRWKTI